MKTKSKILSAILSVSILSASLSAFVSGSFGVQAAESSPTVSANKYKLKDNIQDGVILHCFDWTYNDIKAELPKIAKAGFTSIQTSPAQPNGTGTWYWLYQPISFSIGTNGVGTKAELQSLCDEAEKYGIKIIVDDKAKYTDWSTRDDIKANLQVDLILLLDEFDYPPVTIDDVYKEVLEQAENFKKYAQ